MKSTLINSQYLQRMIDAEKQSDAKTLTRIRDFWWDGFVEAYQRDRNYALNNLDVFMDIGRKRMDAAARKFASDSGFKEGTPEYIQRVTQFLKSNTGKMFERFVGLAIAYDLKENSSKHAIWGFSAALGKFSKQLNPKEFNVWINQGIKKFNINIDADLLIFDPLKPNDFVYMISIKSTLKDRFHNVPFWNLLRILALSSDTELSRRVTAQNRARLENCKYVAICSDLAKEQPDFAGESPRNLLSFDAALLDAAYVSSSKASKLHHSDQHFGFGRDYPFNRLSQFLDSLK